MLHKTSPLAIKTIGDEEGTFAGFASVYDVVDSYNDSVCRGAFSKTIADKGNRVVILNQHDPAQPIGTGTLIDKERGLYVEAKLELGIQAGREAYLALKAGIISGLSIGYETIRDEVRKDGVRLLREVALWEVSCVTFAANTSARVDRVKRVTRGDSVLAGLQKLIADIHACRSTINQRAATLDTGSQPPISTTSLARSEAASARPGHTVPVGRAWQALCHGAVGERRAAREQEQRDRDRRLALQHVATASANYKAAMSQRLDDEEQRAREQQQRYDKWCADVPALIQKGQFIR